MKAAHPTSSQAAAALQGRRARVAVVGAGYFSQFHLQGWADAGADVVALADLQVDRAAQMAHRFGVPSVHTTIGPLLAMQPDVLDVVLPAGAQDTVIRAGMDAGPLVVCQKPFGRDWSHAEALAALARERGRTLVVHENFRFMPWFRECRRWIHEGRLGRVHGVSVRLRPGDGQGPQAYLARQPYFQTMPQFLVKETAVHYIDTFRFLCGEVRAVTARLRRLNPAIAGEDAGVVIFEFDDDRIGLFDGNRLNDHPAQDPRRTMGEMWLEGEAGVLRLDGDAALWFKPHGQPEQSVAYAAGDQDRVFGGAVSALQTHVLAHLIRGNALENTAGEYLENLRVQAAAYHSHATGVRVMMEGFDPNQALARDTQGDTR